jgi:hypothetical protein
MVNHFIGQAFFSVKNWLIAQLDYMNFAALLTISPMAIHLTDTKH